MKHSKVNNDLSFLKSSIKPLLARVSHRPRIMGILNITPDSFSDGGKYLSLSAVARAKEMIAEGADIIDVGAEPTHPGAQPVSPELQIARLLDVLPSLQGLSAELSVDTLSTQVMQAVIPYGVKMINDTAALTDPGALECIAQTTVEVCLMHMQGTPQTMQNAPHYEDVIKEVYDYLASRIEACVAQGISRDRIMIDPGFGFGKTLSHNLQLLTQLETFKRLGCRLLVGMSRKSMLRTMTHKSAQEQVASGLTVALLSLLQGADIIRTHDVGATRDALSVLAALKEEVFA